MFEAAECSAFSILSYILYPYFCSKAGCCVYILDLLSCPRFCIFRVFCHLTITQESLTKFVCAINLAPNSDYKKFFDCLTSKVDPILFLYLFEEISILGNFNVHSQLWLSSPFTDHLGELSFTFAILHDLEQLVLTHYSYSWPSNRYAQHVCKRGKLAKGYINSKTIKRTALLPVPLQILEM